MLTIAETLNRHDWSHHENSDQKPIYLDSYKQHIEIYSVTYACWGPIANSIPTYSAMLAGGPLQTQSQHTVLCLLVAHCKLYPNIQCYACWWPIVISIPTYSAMLAGSPLQTQSQHTVLCLLVAHCNLNPNIQCYACWWPIVNSIPTYSAMLAGGPL